MSNLLNSTIQCNSNTGISVSSMNDGILLDDVITLDVIKKDYFNGESILDLYISFIIIEGIIYNVVITNLILGTNRISGYLLEQSNSYFNDKTRIHTMLDLLKSYKFKNNNKSHIGVLFLNNGDIKTLCFNSFSASIRNTKNINDLQNKIRFVDSKFNTNSSYNEFSFKGTIEGLDELTEHNYLKIKMFIQKNIIKEM